MTSIFGTLPKSTQYMAVRRVCGQKAQNIEYRNI